MWTTLFVFQIAFKNVHILWMIPKTFWKISKIHEMGGEGVFFVYYFRNLFIFRFLGFSCTRKHLELEFFGVYATYDRGGQPAGRMCPKVVWKFNVFSIFLPMRPKKQFRLATPVLYHTNSKYTGKFTKILYNLLV
jgi:hypothetical protein